MLNSMLKRFVACAVLMALLLSLTAGAAFAESANLVSTQNFMAYLDENDVVYTYDGADDNGDEHFSLDYELDNFDSLTCTVIFDSDDDEVNLRVWYIVTPSVDENTILATINQLNNDYKFAKFVYDTSDGTVQAEMDMAIDKNGCAVPVMNAIVWLLSVVDKDEVASTLKSLE